MVEKRSWGVNIQYKDCMNWFLWLWMMIVVMVMDEVYYCCFLIGLMFDDVILCELILNVVF